jgi:hypothetical protein
MPEITPATRTLLTAGVTGGPLFIARRWRRR